MCCGTDNTLKRGFAILVTLYVVVFGTILLMLTKLTAQTGGIGILDFEVCYTTERVAEVFGSYGAGGMTLYARIQLLDVFNPAIYSVLFASLHYLAHIPICHQALSALVHCCVLSRIALFTTIAALAIGLFFFVISKVRKNDKRSKSSM